MKTKQADTLPEMLEAKPTTSATVSISGSYKFKHSLQVVWCNSPLSVDLDVYTWFYDNTLEEHHG